MNVVVGICQSRKSANIADMIITNFSCQVELVRESEKKLKGKNMKIKTHIRYWLWGLAENMDWKNRPPRKLWKWLLQRYDKYFGYRCESPEDKPFDYYPNSNVQTQIDPER